MEMPGNFAGTVATANLHDPGAGIICGQGITAKLNARRVETVQSGAWLAVQACRILLRLKI